MNLEFRDEQLDRLEIDSGFDGGYSPAVVKAFRKLMQYIRAAGDERDFYARKSLHYEKLQGNRSGQRSMRLNDQWRIIVQIDERENGKAIIVVGIEDYH